MVASFSTEQLKRRHPNTDQRWIRSFMAFLLRLCIMPKVEPNFIVKCFPLISIDGQLHRIEFRVLSRCSSASQSSHAAVILTVSRLLHRQTQPVLTRFEAPVYSVQPTAYARAV
jgi:hypothetical protein